MCGLSRCSYAVPAHVSRTQTAGATEADPAGRVHRRRSPPARHLGGPADASRARAAGRIVPGPVQPVHRMCGLVTLTSSSSGHASVHWSHFRASTSEGCRLGRVMRAGAGEPGAARHGIRVSSGGQGAGGAQGWPDAWTGDDQASGGGGGRRDHALGGVEGDAITRSVGVAGDGTTRSVGVGDVATRRSVARRGGGRAEVGAADPPAPSAPTSLCAAPLAPERPPGRRRISCPEGPDTRMTWRRPGPLHDFAKL